MHTGAAVCSIRGRILTAEHRQEVNRALLRSCRRLSGILITAAHCMREVCSNEVRQSLIRRVPFACHLVDRSSRLAAHTPKSCRLSALAAGETARSLQPG